MSMGHTLIENRLPSSTRKFTKVTKPPIACLITEGVIPAIYIDDIVFIGETYEECLIGPIQTIELFVKLDFLIHSEKSSL